jgi:hypothetical protein
VILEDTTTIRAAPGRVFQFFEEMDRHYTAWHPDHLRFGWESGRGVREGVVFSFDERIAGELLKKRVVFTRVVPDRHVEFAPTSRLVRFFLPRMAFHIEPRDGGSVVTALIHVRMGPLAAWLQRRQIAAVRRHMREEGENLRRLLEGAVTA